MSADAPKTLLRIEVAREFSELPFGRYPRHGPNNGERFREDFLVPGLRNFDEVVVNLTGTRGLAPSFLEESFGGLVRVGFTEPELRAHLTIENSDTSYVLDSWSYIEEEQRKQDLASDTAGLA